MPLSIRPLPSSANPQASPALTVVIGCSGTGADMINTMFKENVFEGDELVNERELVSELRQCVIGPDFRSYRAAKLGLCSIAAKVEEIVPLLKLGEKKAEIFKELERLRDQAQNASLFLLIQINDYLKKLEGEYTEASEHYMLVKGAEDTYDKEKSNAGNQHFAKQKQSLMLKKQQLSLKRQMLILQAIINLQGYQKQALQENIVIMVLPRASLSEKLIAEYDELIRNYDLFTMQIEQEQLVALNLAKRNIYQAYFNLDGPGTNTAGEVSLMSPKPKGFFSKLKQVKQKLLGIATGDGWLENVDLALDLLDPLELYNDLYGELYSSLELGLPWDFKIKEHKQRESKTRQDLLKELQTKKPSDEFADKRELSRLRRLHLAELEKQSELSADIRLKTREQKETQARKNLLAELQTKVFAYDLEKPNRLFKLKQLRQAHFEEIKSQRQEVEKEREVFAKLKILGSPQSNSVISIEKIILVGWSRGSVTTLILAHALRQLYPSVKVCIFAVDPVPGPNFEAWHFPISGNIHDMQVVYNACGRHVPLSFFTFYRTQRPQAFHPLLPGEAFYTEEQFANFERSPEKLEVKITKFPADYPCVINGFDRERSDNEVVNCLYLPGNHSSGVANTSTDDPGSYKPGRHDIAKIVYDWCRRSLEAWGVQLAKKQADLHIPFLNPQQGLQAYNTIQARFHELTNMVTRKGVKEDRREAVIVRLGSPYINQEHESLARGDFYQKYNELTLQKQQSYKQAIEMEAKQFIFLQNLNATFQDLTVLNSEIEEATQCLSAMIEESLKLFALINQRKQGSDLSSSSVHQVGLIQLTQLKVNAQKIIEEYAEKFSKKIEDFIQCQARFRGLEQTFQSIVAHNIKIFKDCFEFFSLQQYCEGLRFPFDKGNSKYYTRKNKGVFYNAHHEELTRYFLPQFYEAIITGQITDSREIPDSEKLADFPQAKRWLRKARFIDIKHEPEERLEAYAKNKLVRLAFTPPENKDQAIQSIKQDEKFLNLLREFPELRAVLFILKRPLELQDSYEKYCSLRGMSIEQYKSNHPSIEKWKEYKGQLGGQAPRAGMPTEELCYYYEDRYLKEEYTEYRLTYGPQLSLAEYKARFPDLPLPTLMAAYNKHASSVKTLSLAEYEATYFKNPESVSLPQGYIPTVLTDGQEMIEPEIVAPKPSITPLSDEEMKALPQLDRREYRDKKEPTINEWHAMVRSENLPPTQEISFRRTGRALPFTQALLIQCGVINIQAVMREISGSQLVIEDLVRELELNSVILRERFMSGSIHLPPLSDTREFFYQFFGYGRFENYQATPFAQAMQILLPKIWSTLGKGRKISETYVVEAAYYPKTVDLLKTCGLIAEGTASSFSKISVGAVSTVSNVTVQTMTLEEIFLRLEALAMRYVNENKVITMASDPHTVPLLSYLLKWLVMSCTDNYIFACLFEPRLNLIEQKLAENFYDKLFLPVIKRNRWLRDCLLKLANDNEIGFSVDDEKKLIRFITYLIFNYRSELLSIASRRFAYLIDLENAALELLQAEADKNINMPEQLPDQGFWRCLVQFIAIKLGEDRVFNYTRFDLAELIALFSKNREELYDQIFGDCFLQLRMQAVCQCLGLIKKSGQFIKKVDQIKIICAFIDRFSAEIREKANQLFPIQ